MLPLGLLGKRTGDLKRRGRALFQMFDQEPIVKKEIKEKLKSNKDNDPFFLVQGTSEA